jgi:hypothetical protein
MTRLIYSKTVLNDIYEGGSILLTDYKFFGADGMDVTLKTWLLENCKGVWKWEGMVIQFGTVADALLFKLAWG